MKLFEEVFEKEIKTLKEQDTLLNVEVTSLLSHAMLGDNATLEMKKETFDLMVKGVCDLIWEIKLGNLKVKKTYKCNLDEMQCSEECHGNPKNMDTCSFCTVSSFLTKTD